MVHLHSAPLSLSRAPLAQRLSPNTWLLLGVVLTALSGLRWGIPALAWVAPVPWLLHLRSTDGWRSRLAFALALQLGMFLQVLKITSAPIPWFFAPMYSVPLALGSTALFLLFEAWRRRAGDLWGLVLFPALTVLSEHVTSRASEMGSWGVSAYTQIDDLALLQTTALFGLAGIAVLMGLVAATLAWALAEPQGRSWRPAALVAGGLLLAAWTYGTLRLSKDLDGPQVTVAGVASDIGLDGGGLPSPAALAAANDALFARSERAMQAGARLVVWNEGATAVLPDQEAALLARGQALASTYGADLVLAYVVPLEGMARFENKYTWLGPEGLVETYFKHHPVPGEGSVRGEEPLVVHERPWGRAAGAICYDYDFPALGQAHARQDAGLVFVPSSDWKGIDPIHTQMAAVRGIEGGYSVLRPVRWATSAATDAHGRARATMSWFEDDERLMLARLPTTRVPTLYSRIGDVLPALSVLVLLAGAVPLLPRRGARRARQG